MDGMKKRLTRSKDKMIAGVCGGIAEYLDADPTLIRVAYVLLTIMTAFSGIIAYLVLWIVMPAPKKELQE
ncbi:MAG: PspC domain-containing protein [Tannerellaceae bacterium]|nr:PspC domain-containing protein [Tannerellaceae bacterium]MCC8198331.1 PspC domain-containing protein [Tannerellaceae bacterium]